MATPRRFLFQEKADQNNVINPNNAIAITNTRPIKKILFKGKLYRADYEFIQPGTTADIAYSKKDNGEPVEIKYFTLKSKELQTYYDTKGYKYQTKWQVKTSPLVLLDLMDYPTRLFVYEYILNDEERLAMNTAFPVNTSKKVHRYSSEDTLEKDNLLLSALCRINGIDGYYMPTQESADGGFHSEVGLCRKAFSRIEVVSSLNKGSGSIGEPPSKRRRIEVLENSLIRRGPLFPSTENDPPTPNVGGNRSRRCRRNKLRRSRRAPKQ